MTIKKKVLLLSTALIASTVFSAQAAVINEADLDLDNDTVTISGVGLDSYNGKYVSVLVLKPGKTLDNLNSDLVNGVEKMTQVKIEDGKFNVVFKLNDPDTYAMESMTDGIYKAYISVESLEKVSDFKFDVSMEGMTYPQIMGAADFQSAVNNSVQELNLDNTIYAQLDGPSKTKVLQKTEALKSSINSAEKLKDTIVAMSALQALEENKKSLVFDGTDFINPAVLGLDTLDANKLVKAYEQYETKLTETGRNNVINALCKSHANPDEFINEFVLQTTINAIKYGTDKGTGHIEGVLDANNAVNGLSLTNYKNNKANINDLLVSQTYTTLSQLQAVLNTTISIPEGGNDKPDSSKPSQTPNGTVFAPTTTVEGGVEKFVFKDVTENYSWAKDAIKDLYEAGIISGKSNDTFAPAEKVKRAEFLKILLGVVGIKVESGTSEFADVKASDWYHDYVVTAAKLGLVNGISQTEFGANNNITRQDAAVMIVRACELTGKTLPAGTAKEFFDADFVAEYAKEAVDLLSGAGIVQGTDNQFLPRANCTRAEAAVMLKNVLDKIEG